MEEFLELQKCNLNTFTLFLNLDNPDSESPSQFQAIAESEELSSLFFLTGTQLSNTCEISADSKMVGLSNLFLPELQQMSANKTTAFLGLNPVSLQKEVYVVKALNVSSGEKAGFLISGYDAGKFIARLSIGDGSYLFQTTLLTESGEPFLSSDPSFSLENIQLLLAPTDIEKEDRPFRYFAKLEERRSFLHLFTKSDAKIGIKLPIEASSFALLVDLPEQSSFDISRYELFYRYMTLFLLLFVIGGGVTWWLVKRMARPLRALALNMEQVGEGRLSSHYKKDPLGFEINLLGEQFNAMLEGVASYIEEIKNIKIGRELLLRELKIGHEIQKSIFPKQLPHIESLQIAAGFHPANQVTGDFYDLFLDSSNNLILTLGDAAGKGIPACLFALILRSMLRSAFYTMRAPIDQIIQSTNRLFCMDTQDSGYFATAWVGKLDLTTRQLHFTSCGHLPGLLVRKDGRIEELMTPGTSLGVEEKIEVTVSTVDLFPGDLLLLYSDGIIEAHNPEQKLFGKERLREVIGDAYGMSAEQLKAHIFKEIEAFSENAAQHDDLMLLAIHF